MSSNFVFRLLKNKFKTIATLIQFVGLKVKAYCYSEPQAEKSYCDSKIAHMRTKMKSWVSSRNNILSAGDMKTAIDSSSGKYWIIHNMQHNKHILFPSPLQ